MLSASLNKAFPFQIDIGGVSPTEVLISVIYMYYFSTQIDIGGVSPTEVLISVIYMYYFSDTD